MILRFVAVAPVVTEFDVVAPNGQDFVRFREISVM